MKNWFALSFNSAASSSTTSYLPQTSYSPLKRFRALGSARFTFSVHILNLLCKRVKLRKNSLYSIPVYLLLTFILLLFIITSHLLWRTSAHTSTPFNTAHSGFSRRINETIDKVFVSGCLTPRPPTHHANASFVILTRNKELEGVISSIRSIERHFNRWFHYPYVFLNDHDFTPEFKQSVRQYVSSTVEFGKVDASMWQFPEWVDPDVIVEGIAKQSDQAIMYGGLESYHQMCRFYSGFFHKHPLLQKYKWYWRLEPEIQYFCDITYDPFLKMEEYNKTYGFTIAIKELRETVPNLFRYASAFKRSKGLKSQGMWEMFLEQSTESTDSTLDQSSLSFSSAPSSVSVVSQPPHHRPPVLSFASMPKILPSLLSKKVSSNQLEAMEGETYNMCHFWSNFEIGNLDFFRSPMYNEFFEVLDKSGGFWMERWGDAPIHSLALGALLKPADIHYFRDFGYRHSTIQHCPANALNRQLARPRYLENTTLDEKERIEEDLFWDSWDREDVDGVGCRCKCGRDLGEVEFQGGSCLSDWIRVASAG